jgi:hypothetical protein
VFLTFWFSLFCLCSSWDGDWVMQRICTVCFVSVLVVTMEL